MEAGGERDYKTDLQELASRELRTMPEYRLGRGPDHEKEFTATVLGGEALGVEVGRSRKPSSRAARRRSTTCRTRRA